VICFAFYSVFTIFAAEIKIIMDVAFILDKYFKGKENVSIDVFDAQTLNAVYRDVVTAMTSHFEIEVSVLQALSYCLYEMMDNVHIHSGKPLGTAMTHYDDERKVLRILIADDGMGIRASLAENEKYKDITESEALKLCLEDTITDGKGMGFGLYTTSRLVNSIGKEFIMHSGSHKLITQDGNTTVIENGFWQGTLIYMEIGTGEEIDPNQIVDHRTDVAEEFNEAFVETGELESLW
jgi:anti-sigma regulatory factor (Ser/Thr protein kinase)